MNLVIWMANSKLTGDAKQAWKLIDLHYVLAITVRFLWGDWHRREHGWRWQLCWPACKNAVRQQDLYVSREQFDSIYPDIDPLNNDDWFITADGSQVIKSEDFLWITCRAIGILTSNLPTPLMMPSLTNPIAKTDCSGQCATPWYSQNGVWFA